jgi:hypothetical protein
MEAGNAIMKQKMVEIVKDGIIMVDKGGKIDKLIALAEKTT